MKHKKLLAITTIIVITAFFVGCVEQDAGNDNGDDQNALPDDEIIESIDEEEVYDNNDETEASEELSETEALQDNDLAETEKFIPSAKPFQAFNQARENNLPIVLKFYSDT